MVSRLQVPAVRREETTRLESALVLVLRRIQQPTQEPQAVVDRERASIRLARLVPVALVVLEMISVRVKVSVVAAVPVAPQPELMSAATVEPVETMAALQVVGLFPLEAAPRQAMVSVVPLASLS